MGYNSIRRIFCFVFAVLIVSIIMEEYVYQIYQQFLDSPNQLWFGIKTLIVLFLAWMASEKIVYLILLNRKANRKK